MRIVSILTPAVSIEAPGHGAEIMSGSITLFPVDNGDMTLIELPSGRTILIDTRIRAAADDGSDPTRDVAADLRRRLKRDAQGRLYVDAFLLSHPDEDHCAGLERHFHLGKPDDHSNDKIFIREIWSSPLIFRRASTRHALCDDAKAFNREAKRRVAHYMDSGASVGDGDRILILGRDTNGKTGGLEAILVEVDSAFSRINGVSDPGLSARLLAPLPISDDPDEEDLLSKNNSSVIIQFTLRAGDEPTFFLTGGDAGVAIWERMWQRHAHRPSWLAYDLLQAPHHCSWRVLSHDSWSELREEAKVSADARDALGQARSGACIVSSSKSVEDDDADPPSHRAKQEYLSILKPVSGDFRCTGEHPSRWRPAPMEFALGDYGLSLKPAAAVGAAGVAADTVRGAPLPHG